ncbi:hypothetical protein COV58_02935 [Candidatus Roizmanbacteria bacterium CG11_big_fil_rev_8_21_14_0_20_36_8]|uniref:Uncharacterized protein n=1 Tax=Candidatus Roizmanbacteria bacterium CG11_big_fil_rev_8_21_14_0_20_36_8 TaxID=1974856 RepID=A0A2M6ITX3_9BACT|nr:MAG: hypothetical protein COV58_02935 [Candidatus Roizmanbacteria bacterium CG11_big_fil_rev_8_21_14_0_20_36_8]
MSILKLIFRRFLLIYSLAVIFYVEIYLGIYLTRSNAFAVPPKIMHEASYVYVIFSTIILTISTLTTSFNIYKFLRFKGRNISSMIEWMIVVLISGYIVVTSY